MLLLLRFGFVALVLARIGIAAFRIRQRFDGQSVSLGGRSYDCAVSRQKGRIEQLRLGIPAKDTSCFIARREGRYDRLALWAGIAREGQTRDARFDRAVYTLCDDREMLDALSEHEPLRAAILELLAEPLVEAIHCSTGMLWIDCNASRLSDARGPDQAAAAELAAAAGDRLYGLRNELNALDLDQWNSRRDPALSHERILLAATAFLGCAGLLAFFASYLPDLPLTLRFDAILHRAHIVAAGALVLMLLALWLFLGRTSRTHLVLLDILLVAGPGAWLAGQYWYEFENRRLDLRPPLDHVATIEAKRVSHGRRSTYYYIDVDRWPDGALDRELNVPRSVYDTVVSGQCAHFEYHFGAYGDPWLASVTPATHC